MGRAGVDPSEVWVASPCSAADTLGEQERTVLTGMFGADALEPLANTALFGEASAASVSLQIASVLALAERRTDVAGRVAVITAVAAGAILTMIADTMIPEAFEQTRAWTGLITAVGFLVAFAIDRV